MVNHKRRLELIEKGLRSIKPFFCILPTYNKLTNIRYIHHEYDCSMAILQFKPFYGYAEL